MLRHFSKTVTASVLAVTVALTTLTASATPAAANGHRNDGAAAAAVLGGLLLLYGIANANDGRGNVTIQRNHPSWGGHGGHGGLGGHGGYHNPRIAPARCFVQGHNYRGYIRRCMQRHTAAPHLLPSNCLRQVYTPNGPRQIYGGRFLRNNGWTRG